MAQLLLAIRNLQKGRYTTPHDLTSSGKSHHRHTGTYILR